MALLFLPALESKDYGGILVILILLFLQSRDFIAKYRDAQAAKRRVIKSDQDEEVELRTSGVTRRADDAERLLIIKEDMIRTLDRQMKEKDEEIEARGILIRQLQAQVNEDGKMVLSVKGMLDEFNQRLAEVERGRSGDEVHTSKGSAGRRQR